MIRKRKLFYGCTRSARHQPSEISFHPDQRLSLLHLYLLRAPPFPFLCRLGLRHQHAWSEQSDNYLLPALTADWSSDGLVGQCCPWVLFARGRVVSSVQIPSESLHRKLIYRIHAGYIHQKFRTVQSYPLNHSKFPILLVFLLTCGEGCSLELGALMCASAISLK